MKNLNFNQWKTWIIICVMQESVISVWNFQIEMLVDYNDNFGVENPIKWWFWIENYFWNLNPNEYLCTFFIFGLTDTWIHSHKKYQNACAIFVTVNHLHIYLKRKSFYVNSSVPLSLL